MNSPKGMKLSGYEHEIKSMRLSKVLTFVRRFRASYLRHLISLSILTSSFAIADDADFKSKLRSITNGTPLIVGNGISQNGVVAVTAREVVGARVVWANIPLLRELGFDIPTDTLSPEMEKAILEELAYVVPTESVPSEKLGHRTKKFYSDVYGGTGLGYSVGSGRAAAAGAIQSKGIGTTPLADPSRDGHESLEGAIKDALWGEVLNLELPFGANRSLFVIATPLQIQNKRGKTIRALNIRVNPLRPAHYLSPYYLEYATSDQREIVKKSIRSNLTGLEKYLPDGPYTTQQASTSLNEALRSGIFNLAWRLGQQYGTAYVKRIYHGADSPSNQLLDGGMIDFGTTSMQPGYSSIRTLDHMLPFGHEYVSQVVARVLGEFIDGLRLKSGSGFGGWLSGSKRKNLYAEAERIFRKTYDEVVRKEFLNLTGAPREFIAKVDPKISRDLSDYLNRLTLLGREYAYSADEPLPKKARINLIAEIFSALSDLPEISEDSLSKLKVDNLSPDMLRKFPEVFFPFYQEIVRQAAAQNISEQSVRKFMSVSSRSANQPVDNLYLGNLIKDLEKLSSNFRRTNDPAEINSYITASVKKARDRVSVGNRSCKNLFRGPL